MYAFVLPRIDTDILSNQNLTYDLNTVFVLFHQADDFVNVEVVNRRIT